MKKIFFLIFYFFLSFLILITFVLTTNGIKTKRFNNFITQKINQSNSKINLQLETIKFKLDISELSLFLETKNPKIFYRNVKIPTQNIKVYVDFLPLIRSETRIKKINFVLKQIDIDQLKNLSSSLKPSNLNSFINNKLLKAKVDTEIEAYFNKDKYSSVS